CGNVQLLIFAKQPHYFVAVDAHGLAKISDLICKAYLQAVKAVARVLDCFSDTQGDNVTGCLDVRIEIEHRFGMSGRNGADDCKWRILEVIDGRSLSKELRIRAHREVLTMLHSGRRFD